MPPFERERFAPGNGIDLPPIPDVDEPDQVVETFGERLIEPEGVLFELAYVVVVDEASSPGGDSILS